MKLLTLIFIFFGFFCKAQPLQAVFKDSVALKAARFIGNDGFGNTYFINNNIFFKENNGAITPYNNLQLGPITSVDILNPLEIVVFFADFNAMVKLDNRLNEILKIDFNQLSSFRNVQFCTTANDKNLWIFNADLQQLEIFNYQQNTITPINQPINQPVLSQKSNYNFCWLLTESYLYKYNIYGSMLYKLPLEGFNGLWVHGKTIILKKEEKLYCLLDGETSPSPLNLPEFSIKDVFMHNDNLYIYHGDTVSRFTLQPVKNQ